MNGLKQIVRYDDNGNEIVRGLYMRDAETIKLALSEISAKYPDRDYRIDGNSKVEFHTPSEQIKSNLTRLSLKLREANEDYSDLKQ